MELFYESYFTILYNFFIEYRELQCISKLDCNSKSEVVQVSKENFFFGYGIVHL